MDFIVAERDIQFVLFEYLQMQKLLEFPRWKDYDVDTLKMTLAEAIKTATGVLAPLNAPGDEEGSHFEDGKVITPKGFKEAYKQYVEAGWLGLSSDPDFGGQGLPVTLGLACSEAFVSANNSLTMAPGLTRGGAAVIVDYGSEEQKQRYVAKVLSGEWAGTMCLTEPQAGTAVGDVRTLATPDGNGGWKIVGTKSFITYGDHDLTKQIIHLVLARTPGAPPGIKGISLFIVPKYRIGADGGLGEFNDVKCSGIEHKMGIHASPTCTLNFGDAGQCVGELIGERNKGIVYMFKLMNEARVGVGLQGLSQAALAYQLALKYAKERVQGTDILAMKDPNAPRIEIIKHPDVRRMLLSMKAIVDGCRALLLSVAFFEDMLRATNDQNWHMLVELLTPVCKAYCSDRGFEATATAIQVLGGYGYCTEYGVEQLCRDAKIASIYEGANGIQALDLVGRKLGQAGGMFFMNFMNRMTDMVNANKAHPALGDLIADFDKAKNKLGEVTMNFAMKGRANPLYPVSYATPFLAMMGDVTIGYLLLDMALVASKKLDAIYAEKAAADEAAKKALRQSHAEAAFYHGKMQTARFFVKQMLPDVFAKAMSAASEDMSLLDIEL
jgi:alkylation response protein AidB-like acyl-CoA dehydrogenase